MVRMITERGMGVNQIIKHPPLLGGDIKPRHVHTFSVSPDLEVEARSH